MSFILPGLCCACSLCLFVFFFAYCKSPNLIHTKPNRLRYLQNMCMTHFNITYSLVPDAGNQANFNTQHCGFADCLTLCALRNPFQHVLSVLYQIDRGPAALIKQHQELVKTFAGCLQEEYEKATAEDSQWMKQLLLPHLEKFYQVRNFG